MELVIKIPDEQYDVIKGDLYNTFPNDMRKWGLEAIRNGIPLPKGHGRLIDESQITKVYMQTTEEENINGARILSRIYIVSTNAPTVIKADKEV